MATEVTPAGYRPLDADTVVEFARSQLPGAGHAREIGDGNLNLVFEVRAEDGAGVIVKQALPYLRIVGEAWPLSLDRARIEAEALELQHRLAPGSVPRLLHYDAELAAIVMEHLDRHEIWRTALNEQRSYPEASTALGAFCGKTLLGTSDLGMVPAERKALNARFLNPQLCAITEELVFTAPYVDADSNDIEEHLLDEAERLRSDRALAARVGELRFRFRTNAEAIIHGDLHTGSVMVADDDTRAIDPEFAFPGPMGFDVGAVLGNLALAYVAHRAQGHDEFAATLPAAASDFWTSTATTIAEGWPASDAPWRERFLERLLVESGHYAGAKMIRRIVGLAHVTDITGIADARQRYRAQVDAIEGGRALILAPSIRSLEQLWALATDEGAA